MAQIIIALTSLAMLGYLYAAWAIYYMPHKYKTIATAMGISLSAHTVQALYNFSGLMQQVSITNILSLISVCLVIIGTVRYFIHYERISYVVLSLTAIICLWLPIIAPTPITVTQSWALKVHIALSISAYVALAFAALYACYLLLQDYQLRKGADGFNFSIPLREIERTMMNFTLFGEVLLSLALATGLVFIYDVSAQHISHKLFFGAISWVIISSLLILHRIKGFRGRPAAILLLTGFAFLILSYFGSTFILQIILQR